MSALSNTFVRCCFVIIQTRNLDESRCRQLVKVIDTLDLSPSNLAVALIYLSKYQSNSVNSIENSESDTLHYYMIVASLILANKFVNDQSYTLKTWHSILLKCSDFRPTLALLNQLEQNFLASLDFVLATKHNPALWLQFGSLNWEHVMQLQMAVDCSSSLQIQSVPKAVTPPICDYGLATPPSAFTIYTSPLSLADTISPSPGAPYTPLALPSSYTNMIPSMPQFAQFYPSPMPQHTPQHISMAGEDWHQPTKRRKLGHGACGVGFAFEPALTTYFNV